MADRPTDGAESVSTTDEKGHDSDPLIGQNIAENRYKIVRIIGELSLIHISEPTRPY